MEYAGFWRRFCASIIDGIILSIILYIIALILGTDLADIEQNITINVISIILGIVYFAWFNSSEMQATPGKRVMGCYIIDKNGNRITFLRALGRYFAMIISAIPLMIGYLMVAFTQKKTGLHDIIASTYVIKS